MSHVVQPFSFLAGTEVLGTGTEGWNLDQLPEPGGEDRWVRTTIRFTRPFNATPLVHLGVTGFDISNQDAARFKVTTSNVTPEGFDLVVSTWLNSRLWRAEVGWLAIGA